MSAFPFPGGGGGRGAGAGGRGRGRGAAAGGGAGFGPRVGGPGRGSGVGPAQLYGVVDGPGGFSPFGSGPVVSPGAGGPCRPALPFPPPSGRTPPLAQSALAACSAGLSGRGGPEGRVVSLQTALALADGASALHPPTFATASPGVVFGALALGLCGPRHALTKGSHHGGGSTPAGLDSGVAAISAATSGVGASRAVATTTTTAFVAPPWPPDVVPMVLHMVAALPACVLGAGAPPSSVPFPCGGDHSDFAWHSRGGPLQHAASVGHRRCVAMLILRSEAAARRVARRRLRGPTQTETAVAAVAASMLQPELDMRSSITGCNALNYATLHGDAAMALLLVAHGATPAAAGKMEAPMRQADFLRSVGITPVDKEVW